MPEENRNITSHISGISKMRQYAQNEYEHADSLTRSDLDDEKEMLSNFSMMVDKHVQLCNIAEPVVRFYQQDEVNLVNLASQARRMPALQPLFFVLYYGWRDELLITKAKDGKERGLQGVVGTKYVPRERMQGYGSEFPGQDDPTEENLLDKLFGGKKKKQQGV